MHQRLVHTIDYILNVARAVANNAHYTESN